MNNKKLTDERLDQFAEIAAQHGFFDATTGEVESMVTELRERRQADKNFFMYGIADPDGCAHMDEFCVSGDKGLLEATADELNLNEGTDGYRVVALYTALPLTGSEREELQQYRKAAMQQEPRRNPVLAHADSYRDMAKQGIESIPVWSVITDLERNIAPLYAVPPARLEIDAAEKRIVELNHHISMLTARIEPTDRLVDELTMWVKRLAHSLKYANQLSKLPGDAMDYLSSNGLISVEDVLR